MAFIAVHPGMGSAAGSPPTSISDCVTALRHYVAEKALSNSGDFLDVMTGDVVPF